MLILAMSMLAGFVVGSLLKDNFDDDDGPPDGGLMTPVYAPSPS